MQYTSKTKDIWIKGEGKGLVDLAASEPMAFWEEKYHICFTRNNVIRIHYCMAWNILPIQNTGSTFQLVGILSSFCRWEILLVWKKAGRDVCLPEQQWDFHPEKYQMYKQATCPGNEQKSENPKESAHDPAHMSWHQGRRWMHNKYSNSKTIFKSHCSPNIHYPFFLNINSQTWFRYMGHADQSGWRHASRMNTADITTAKQDVWWRHTPESNSSKIQQVFTVAKLPFSCVQGSAPEAF